VGVTPTNAVTAAMEANRRKSDRSPDRKKLDGIFAELQALPVLDSRSADEILGYDALGIPR
jgi:hypothetical protein